MCHRERFFRISWHSILWNLACKDSIVKFYFVLDYGLLRLRLAMTAEIIRTIKSILLCVIARKFEKFSWQSIMWHT
ncbi:hypothetical protein [Helicobacter rodentium]|uniref:hypothetical protein n=1 Tax=Helicobacter rodentium TaxID=59617 RepID=UPI0012EBEF93|nr:hypothetical protein [Helicobacter rodentium]